MHRLPINSKVPKCLFPEENPEEQNKIDNLGETSQESTADRQEQSKHQRKMYRIPANSKARRRLFPEENIEEQARIDNFANILQESAARDRQEKSKKWNFDFVNEVPLNGPYEWYKRDEDEWIGMKIKCEDLDVSDKDKSLQKQFENENTPVHVRDESVPVIRKRRKDIENGVGSQGVKRKVDFDQCTFLRRTDY